MRIRMRRGFAQNVGMIDSVRWGMPPARGAIG